MSEIDYINGRKAYALKTKEGLYISYDPAAGSGEAYSTVTRISDLNFWDIFTESFSKRARYIQDYARAGWKVTKLNCTEKKEASEVAAWICFGCTTCKRKEARNEKN
jgi:hypothetical protein